MTEPAAGAPTQATSSKAKWAIAGCCGCLLLAALLFLALGGGAFFVAWKATEPAKAEARAFLEKAGAGDVEGAHRHFSEPLKAELDLPKFKAMVEANPDLFKAADTTFTSFSYRNAVVNLRGTVTSKTGKVRNCLFRLVREGETWRLFEFRITDDPIPGSE
jgi:hypothetical protein